MVTYLVFDISDDSLAGYFSLAIKPISVLLANISKTTAKKLSRTSILDKDAQSYVTSAYLIAQLGKNYSLPKEKQISGSVLLDLALDTVSNLQYSIGGVMEFLECEDNPFLLQFYKENHFKPFDRRLTLPFSGNVTAYPASAVKIHLALFRCLYESRKSGTSVSTRSKGSTFYLLLSVFCYSDRDMNSFHTHLLLCDL